MRKAGANGGGAGEIFGLKNQALDHGVNEKRMGNDAGFETAKAAEIGRTAGLVDNVKNSGAIALQNGSEILKGMPVSKNPLVAKMQGGLGAFASTGSKGGTGNTTLPDNLNGLTPGGETSGAMKGFLLASNMRSIDQHRKASAAGNAAAAGAQDAHWRQSNEGLQAGGKNQYAGNLQEGLKFDTDSAVWEAKNAFASHVSSSAGIAGMNAGSLSAGHKPSDMTGMAMNGVLDGYKKSDSKTPGGFWQTAPTNNGGGYGGVSGSAGYSGTGFLKHSEDTMKTGLAIAGSGQITGAFQDQTIAGVGIGGIASTIGALPSEIKGLGDVFSNGGGFLQRQAETVTGGLSAPSPAQERTTRQQSYPKSPLDGNGMPKK